MSDRIKTNLAVISIFIIMALKFAAMFFPEARLWGINHLAYFSTYFAVIYLLLVVLLIYVITIKPEFSQLKRITSAIIDLLCRIPKALLIVIAAVLCLTAFYVYSDSANILGDGVLRIAELDKYYGIPATEPLDFIIHHFSYKYIFEPLGLSARTCFQFWSYLAGLLYIWAAWLFAGKLTGLGIEKRFTFVYILGWGGAFMFFGYAENYAFAAVFLMFFFNSAVEYINNKKSPLPLIVLFLLAFFMHNTIVFLMPSLIYLLLIKYKQNRSATVYSFIVVMAVIVLWMAFSYGGKEGGAFLLPDSASDSSYILWSRAHLVDMLNELLLISPAFLILIWLQQKGSKTMTTRLHRFFWAAGLSGLTAALFIDPILGLPRDWDLFALLLLSFHIAIFAGVDWSKQSRLIKSSVAVIPLAFTCVWILLNSDEARAINRYKDIVDLDEARSRYGYEVLGSYYYRQERWGKAEQAYYQSLRITPHYRLYLWLGNAQFKIKKYIEAELNYKKSLEINPGYSFAVRNLGLLYYDMRRYNEAKAYLEAYIQNPESRDDIIVIKTLTALDSLLCPIK